jgi:hypothetical protein
VQRKSQHQQPAEVSLAGRAKRFVNVLPVFTAEPVRMAATARICYFAEGFRGLFHGWVFRPKVWVARWMRPILPNSVRLGSIY